MSIVIANLRPDQALLATDTFAATSSGGGEYTKLFPLAHLSAVIAGRGVARIIAGVSNEACLSGKSFDELVTELPLTLDEVYASAERCLDELPIEKREVEIFLVGHSDALGHMVAAAYRKLSGSPATLALYPAGTVLAAPWIAEMGALPTAAEISTTEGLIAVARRQCEQMDRLYPPKASGGRLIVARISRGRIETNDLGNLDDPAGRLEQDLAA